MNLRRPPCLQLGWTSREVWPRWVWSLVNSLNLRVYPWIRYDHDYYPQQSSTKLTSKLCPPPVGQFQPG